MSVTAAAHSHSRRRRGIALAIVLVLVILMITSVYTFSRRAILNAGVTQNRLAGAEAEALARGGLRIAEAMVYLVRLQEQAESAAGGSEGADAASLLQAALGGGQDLWAQLGDLPIELEQGQQLRVEIEETRSRLNLNALVAQDPEDQTEGETSSVAEEEEALEYLVEVLRHIVEGIDAPAEDKAYDVRRIAESLIDYMDADDISLSGGSEDDYYRSQEPPYRPRNGPLLSFDEIGLVEGVDPQLLEELRHYVTVHPIGGRSGIDMNRAPAWVLPLVYSGPSGDRELLSERTVRRILAAKEKGQRICTDGGGSPECVSPIEVGLDEGSVYPETALPAPVEVFRVVSEARVDGLVRRLEAVYDTRPSSGPQLLSWRRLRGSQ